MRKYKVLIYGRNFRLPFVESKRTKIKITGFYTWRCVFAHNEVEAEFKAIDLIRQDSQLRRSLKNSPSDRPIMQVEELLEVKSFSPIKKGGTGYAFFHGRGSGKPRKLRLAKG
jgi:hypothetical protein